MKKYTDVKNILFVCSRNKWRSPTGEKVWCNHPQINVRSAGTSDKAKKTINVNDVQWSDIIFVMEEKHKNRLTAKFAKLLKYKEIYVLDIPDDYQYMDSDLVDIMKQSVGSYLESV